MFLNEEGLCIQTIHKEPEVLRKAPTCMHTPSQLRRVGKKHASSTARNVMFLPIVSKKRRTLSCYLFTPESHTDLRNKPSKTLFYEGKDKLGRNIVSDMLLDLRVLRRMAIDSGTELDKPSHL